MFWTNFENSKNRTQIDKNQSTIVQGWNGFSATFFKITAKYETKHEASDETIPTFS